MKFQQSLSISVSQELEDNFQEKLQEIWQDSYPEKIIIAVSGGIDSMALLFLAQKFCQKKNVDLVAITIDHKIREESIQEANFVAKICQDHQIKHQILENNYFIPKSNIESNLREIRYELLINFAKKNKIKNILIAHHEQDVAENFLIRLFRGSGIDGLSSMEEISEFKNTNLVRPLLDFSKEELQKYLKEKNIDYIEDPSNKDQKFLRNKIRHFLNEFPEKNLINQRIVKASKNILENRKIIENLIEEKSSEIYQFNQLGYYLVHKNNFKNLHKELALRYLNLIFNHFNGKFYKSRFEKINNLYDWLIQDQIHKANNFNGAIIEDFNEENFIIYREKSKIKNFKITQYSFIWDNIFKIEIDENINLDNLEIITFDAKEFNLLLKDPKFRKYQNLKNPLKKIFYTIPIIKKNNEIIAIYHLLQHSSIKISL
jgi:tRNA(Ile)-lysidine synthase